MKPIDLHLINVEQEYKLAINHAFDLGWEASEERIIKLLEEHVWQLDIAPDKSWKQRCRCGFYGVFNEHLTALIKGKK